MNMTTNETERAIEEILGVSKPDLPMPSRQRGRSKKPRAPIWSLEFYNPDRNRTFALISMCIKDDFNQSIRQLALRLSVYKSRPPMECLNILRMLKNAGRLGYYDSDRVFRTWHGEEAGYGLEDLCG